MWGREKETVGRQEYFSSTVRLHTNFKIRESGLFINANYPFLGASSYAVISCDCYGIGLLEIKCPYKYRDEHPTSSIALADPNYYLKKDSSGIISLSARHKYYDQVQGQMGVYNLEYCDFVTWTKVSFFVERILRKQDYMTINVRQLKRFFESYLLPELLTHHFEQQLSDTIQLTSKGMSTSSCLGKYNFKGKGKFNSKGKGKSDSKGKGKSDSKGKGKSDSIGKGKSDSKGKGKYDSKGKGKSTSKSKGKGKFFKGKSLVTASEDLSSEVATESNSKGKGKYESDQLYCFCQTYESGTMIACDDPQCPIEWFHFSD
jgi:hypothetical protein